MPLTLYSTIRGLASALVSAALVVTLGGYGVLTVGLRPWPTTVLVIGLGLLVVTLLDYPRRAVFADDGIRRVSFLRSHVLDWEDVNAIERSQTGFLTRRWRLPGGSSRSDGPPPPPSNSGLVARLGKRRYLLVNVVESAAEYDHLSVLVRRLAPHAYFGAPRPAHDAVPTDLYRKKRRRTA